MGSAEQPPLEVLLPSGAIFLNADLLIRAPLARLTRCHARKYDELGTSTDTPR